MPVSKKSADKEMLDTLQLFADKGPNNQPPISPEDIEKIRKEANRILDYVDQMTEKNNNE